MLSLVFIFIFIILFFVSYFILKNKILCIVVSWWMFWIFISSLSITGLYDLNYYTYLIFILFPVFAVIGSFFRKILSSTIYSLAKKDILNNNYYLLVKLLVIVLLLTFLYIGISLYLFRDYFNPLTYRSIIFTEDSPLYSNKYIDLLFSMILRPLYFSCLFVGAACIIIYKNKKLFLVGLFFLIITSLAEFGRFGFYIIIVMFIYLWIMGVKFKKIYLYLSSSLFLILIVYISSLRSSSDENLIDLLFYQYFLNYHTFSLSIFNLDLMDKTSRLHDMTLGLSSILSIFDPFVILLRVFGLDIVPESGVMAKSLDEMRDIGFNNDGFPITANAFGSNLYGLYRDGGLFFVLFFSFFYGYIVQSLNFNTKSSIIKAASMCSMFYFGIFGIFMPLVQFPWLVGFLYIIIFDKFFINKSIVKQQINLS